MQTIDEKQLRLDCTNLLCRAEWHITVLRQHYAKHQIQPFVQAAKELMEEFGEFGERYFNTPYFNITTEQIFLLLKNTLRLQEEFDDSRIVSRWFKTEAYSFARAEFGRVYREYVDFVGGFLKHCSKCVLVNQNDATQAAFREGAAALVSEFHLRSSATETLN